MSQLKRKILFPTAVYFKDILNSKELNKNEFIDIIIQGQDFTVEGEQVDVIKNDWKVTFSEKININVFIFLYYFWDV